MLTLAPESNALPIDTGAVRTVRSFQRYVELLAPVLAGPDLVGRPQIDPGKAHQHLEVLDELVLQLLVLGAEADQ